MEDQLEEQLNVAPYGPQQQHQQQPNPQQTKINVELRLASHSIFQFIALIIFISLTIKTVASSLFIATGFLYVFIFAVKFTTWKALAQFLPQIKIDAFFVLRLAFFCDFYEAIIADRNASRPYMRFLRIIYILGTLLIFGYSFSSFSMCMGKSTYGDMTEFKNQYSLPFTAMLYMSIGGALSTISLVEFFKGPQTALPNLRQRILQFIYTYSFAFTQMLFFVSLTDIWYLLGSFYIFLRIAIGYLLSSLIFSTNKIIKVAFPQFQENQLKQYVQFPIAVYFFLGATFDVSPIFRLSHFKYDKIVSHYSVRVVRVLTLLGQILVTHFVLNSIDSNFKSYSWMYYLTIALITTTLCFNAVWIVLFLLNLKYKRWHTINLINLVKQNTTNTNHTVLDISPSINGSIDRNLDSGLQEVLVPSEKHNDETDFIHFIGENAYKEMKNNFMLEYVQCKSSKTLEDPALKQVVFNMIEFQMKIPLLKKSSILMADAVLTSRFPKKGMAFILGANSTNEIIEFIETVAFSIPPTLPVSIIIKVSLDTRQRFRLMRAVLDKIPLQQLQFTSLPTAKVSLLYVKHFYKGITVNQKINLLSSIVFFNQVSPLLCNNPRQVLYDLYEDI